MVTILLKFYCLDFSRGCRVMAFFVGLERQEQTLEIRASENASLDYSNHFRVSVNVNNLTNKEYYIGYWSVNPQKPRNATLSIAYKF